MFFNKNCFYFIELIEEIVEKDDKLEMQNNSLVLRTIPSTNDSEALPWQQLEQNHKFLDKVN